MTPIKARRGGSCLLVLMAAAALAFGLFFGRGLAQNVIVDDDEPGDLSQYYVPDDSDLVISFSTDALWHTEPVDWTVCTWEISSYGPQTTAARAEDDGTWDYFQAPGKLIDQFVWTPPAGAEFVEIKAVDCPETEDE